MIKKEILNDKMKKILSALYHTEGMMTPNEISKETGVSYITVEKYLNLFEEKGIIHRTDEIPALKQKRRRKKRTGGGRSATRWYSINSMLTPEKLGATRSI